MTTIIKRLCNLLTVYIVISIDASHDYHSFFSGADHHVLLCRRISQELTDRTLINYCPIFSEMYDRCQSLRGHGQGF